ncbi:unnamed protein product [Cyprideis torosa]|uniref:Glutamyl-tRNA reductase n=1 Tax=Cyprideis torosa TaxID=163714 RepID=A0A7R8ZQJ8_9CRUS|nr:unnamed protein product [Cyprideis torosa]CAG0901570.1 unnamed protein product [Cyprideis torosa]
MASTYFTIDDFYAISLSFNKADAKTRGRFALFPEHIPSLLNAMEERGLSGFAISTCNRSEYYAFADNYHVLMQVYCSFCEGTETELEKYVQIFRGEEAVTHLFRVSAGLESQILGDFEVVGQIRSWYSKFRKNGLKNSGIDRLIQTATQISKKIKAETVISDGATSVSYAAANFIRQEVENLESKKILLLGTGKIGQNTLENLVKHVEPGHIYLINRTVEKARKLSNKYHVHLRSYKELKATIQEVDVIIVATGAHVPVLDVDMVQDDKKLLILDLSIPENVHPDLAALENIQYKNVDQISQLINETLKLRRSDIPKAETIIRLEQYEFMEWINARKHIPSILGFKNKLELLRDLEQKELGKKQDLEEDDLRLTNNMIQRLSNYLAQYLKDHPAKAEEVRTRKSPLALWQAEKVKAELSQFFDGEIEIVPVSSEGDQNQNQPIYSLGITGVFTRSLDLALLNKEIDIAVHSLKDMPTTPAQGISLIAVLERDFNQDVLVLSPDLQGKEPDWERATIATGSLRRRAFLKNKYPSLKFVDIRGNVQTRLKKMQEGGYAGTVLSKAGLKRMNMSLPTLDLDFMLPSVGQGVIALAVGEEQSSDLLLLLNRLNHQATFRNVLLERSFLKTLEGGCTAPIGVRLREMEKGEWHFKGSLLSLEGDERIDVEEVLIVPFDPEEEGVRLAKKILDNGGSDLMKRIKREMQNFG